MLSLVCNIIFVLLFIFLVYLWVREERHIRQFIGAQCYSYKGQTMNTLLYEVCQFLNNPSLNRSDLHSFILHSLPALHLSVYTCVQFSPQCDSSQVANQLGIKLNHADNILLELVNMNLLVRDKSAGVYRYSVVEV